MARVVKRQTGSASASRKKPQNDLDDVYIPDGEAYTSYIGRQIDNVPDMEILEYAMSENMNVMLSGPTGAGKTRVGEAFAAKNGHAYYSVPCDVSIDPSALFGKMVPTDVAGKFVWQDGPVTKLTRTGGVLNLSEVNAMSPKIAMALFSLLDSRRRIMLLANHGEVITPEPGALLIIADYNPGYRGTQIMNAAFMNRFPLKIQWGYDPAVEEKLVESASLLTLAAKLRASVDIRTPVSTNALMEFEAIARKFGASFAVSNFVAAFEPLEQDALNKVLEVSRNEIDADVAKMRMRNAVVDMTGDDDVEEFEDDEEDEDGHVFVKDDDDDRFFG